jgi:hypothetical protein
MRSDGTRRKHRQRRERHSLGGVMARAPDAPDRRRARAQARAAGCSQEESRDAFMPRPFPASIHDAIRRARLCGAGDGLAEGGVDARSAAMIGEHYRKQDKCEASRLETLMAGQRISCPASCMNRVEKLGRHRSVPVTRSSWFCQERACQENEALARAAPGPPIPTPNHSSTYRTDDRYCQPQKL